MIDSLNAVLSTVFSQISENNFLMDYTEDKYPPTNYHPLDPRWASAIFPKLFL